MPHIDHYRNGNKLVSVTELQSIIAKPFLEKWKQSLCSFQEGQCGFVKAKAVAEEAANLGNLVHEDVARYLANNDEINMTEWSKNIIKQIKLMNIKKYLIEPETTLVDDESNLAGSPDALVTVNGSPAILDLKIKNQLDAGTDDQGCGYRYLIKRLYGVTLDKMLVLWAKKKTKSMLVEPVWFDLKANHDNWLALVTRWNKANPKRKVIIHA